MRPPPTVRLVAALLSVSLLVAGVRAASSGAALTDTVNWVRLRGCNASITRPALHENSRLDKAARRVARGGALRDALAG